MSGDNNVSDPLDTERSSVCRPWAMDTRWIAPGRIRAVICFVIDLEFTRPAAKSKFREFATKGRGGSRLRQADHPWPKSRVRETLDQTAHRDGFGAVLTHGGDPSCIHSLALTRASHPPPRPIR